MESISHPAQWILGMMLILSSIGVLLAHKPLYASLSFLASLLILATIYAELSAEFIAVMQILVYAGAILVIFVFVIVLFQDAHEQINRYEPKSKPLLLAIAIATFLYTLFLFGIRFINHFPPKAKLEKGFGSVKALGEALYIDFFFPFEAVILIFLVALIGSLYIAKREK